MITEIHTEEAFRKEIATREGLSLIDFWATWCGPCKMVAPILDEVAEEVAGKAKVYKVDVDQSPDLAQRYSVMSVPTMIVFENGQIKKTSMGAQPKQGLLALLD